MPTKKISCTPANIKEQTGTILSCIEFHKSTIKELNLRLEKLQKKCKHTFDNHTCTTCNYQPKTLKEWKQLKDTYLKIRDVDSMLSLKIYLDNRKNVDPLCPLYKDLK